MSGRHSRRRQAGSDRRKNSRRLALEPLEPRQLLTIFFVLNNADSGVGSFRQALLDANDEQVNPGPDVIDFSRLPSDETTITLRVRLEAITSEILIDGWSHPDYVQGSFDPVIRIDGNDEVAEGLTFGISGGQSADRSVVRGLAITQFQGNGISVLEADGLQIYGNHIGVDTDGGTPRPNGGHGIFLQNSRDNRIGTTETANGGDANAAPNVIAENGRSSANFGGISIVGIGNSSINNRISRNVILNNGRLGIDLGNNGPTANDPLDADQGPNRLQNFPEIDFAQTRNEMSMSRTIVTGNLRSAPDTRYEVQFFANDTQDGSGFGEGQRYLGNQFVTTDGSGVAAFTFIRPYGSGEEPQNAGFITATAIDPDGNTSEFSQAEMLDFFTDQIDLSVDIVVPPDPVRVGEPLNITVTVTNNNGNLVAPNVLLNTFLPSAISIDPSQILVTQGAEPAPTPGNLLSWEVGDLAPGSSATLTLTPRPAVPGIISILSTVASGSVNDPNPGDNADREIVAVFPNPDIPIISFLRRDYTVAESGGFATIEVIRTNNPGGTVTVDYETIDSSAIAGVDYVSRIDSLTFAPNELTKTITVPILDDAEVDPNRSLRIQLSNATLVGPMDGVGEPIVGVPGLATLTIFDDDPSLPPPQFLQFAQSELTVPENQDEVEIVVRRTGGVSGNVSVSYSTLAGDAIPDQDFTPTSDSLAFESEAEERRIRIPIIDNLDVDGNRSFFVTLDQGRGAAVGSPSQIRITIIDDESPPVGTFQFSMSDYSAVEDEGRATITVVREGGSGPATISYNTIPGTAQPGVRYRPASGTLQFAQGEMEKSFSVELIDTPSFLGPQTVILELVPGEGAALGANARATLTITDNESAPMGLFQFETSSITIDESAGVARLTVNRAGGAFDAASIGVATAVGNAVAGVDYESIAVRLSFAPGETSKTVEIPIIDNTAFDGDRAFGVFLGFPEGNAAIGTPGSAVVLIRNNDPDPVVPSVADVRSIGFGNSISTVGIFFNKPMDPASALDPSNYSAVAHGRDGVLGTADDRAIPIAGIGRSDDGQIVALSLASAVPGGEFLTVVINGQPGGLLDLSGNLIDGDGDGLAGGNFSTSLVRASRLSYRDSDGDLITYAATGGGIVEVKRGAPGTGDVVRILDAVPGRTVLRGQVVRQRGGDGIALIRRIEGIDPFGRVRSALRTPPFIDLSQVAPAAVDAILAAQARRPRR